MAARLVFVVVVPIRVLAFFNIAELQRVSCDALFSPIRIFVQRKVIAHFYKNISLGFAVVVDCKVYAERAFLLKKFGDVVDFLAQVYLPYRFAVAVLAGGYMYDQRLCRVQLYIPPFPVCFVLLAEQVFVRPHLAVGHSVNLNCRQKGFYRIFFAVPCGFNIIFDIISVRALHLVYVCVRAVILLYDVCRHRARLVCKRQRGVRIAALAGRAERRDDKVFVPDFRFCFNTFNLALEHDAVFRLPKGHRRFVFNINALFRLFGIVVIALVLIDSHPGDLLGVARLFHVGCL